MNLTTAIIYYVCMFLATTVCIVAGCFCGAKLRNKKDAKAAATENFEK